MFKLFKELFDDVTSRLVSERGDIDLNDKEPGVKFNEDNSISTSVDEEFAKKFTEMAEKEVANVEEDDEPGEEENADDSEKKEEVVETKPVVKDEEILEYLRGKGFEGDSVDSLIADAKGKKTYQKKHQETTTLNSALSQDPRFEALVKEIVMEKLTGSGEKPKQPKGFEKYSPKEIELMREQARFLVDGAEKKEPATPGFDPDTFKQELLTELDERNEFKRFENDYRNKITPRINQIMQMVAKTHGISNVSYSTLTFLYDTAKRLEQEAIDSKTPKDNGKEKLIGNPPVGARTVGKEEGELTLKTAKTDEDFQKVFEKMAKQKGWFA